MDAMSSRVRAALAAVVVVAVAVTVPIVARDPAAPATASDGASVAAAAAPPLVPQAVRVLAAWDRERTAAWAAGDVVALRGLYAAGSRTGSRDVAMLSAYAARGLRVRGLEVQLLAWEVRDRSPTQVRLVVTDRVVGGVVAGAGETRSLPADQPSRRIVRFVRRGEQWLVAEVIPARGS